MTRIEEEYVDPNYVPTKTNWFTYDVNTMWQYVNRQLDNHYNQSQGWKMATELSSFYHSRLLTYRDQFAQQWQNSPAQEAFMVEMNKLIDSVKNTYDIAAANYQASLDIPNSIWEAKYKLQPLVNAYNAAKSDQAKIDNGTPQLTPSPPRPGETKPPTPTQLMDTNRYAAASVMYDLSESLLQAQKAFRPPQPYLAPGSKVDHGGDYGGSNGGGNIPPPFIPPVIPPPPPPPSLPPATLTPVPTPTAPDLTGLKPTPTPVITPPTLPTPVTPPLTTGYPPTPGIIGPLPPGRLPLTGGVPGVPGMMPGGVAPASTRSGVMPPGGMIGGAAGARGTSGARALPPGGMIGGAPGGRGGAAGGKAGRNGMPYGPMGGMHGGRPGHDEETGEDFDPDTQWHVAQGVAPVVEADFAPGPIDPGPAIGLNQ